MRGRTPGFDSFDPPADGGRPASDALVQEPTAGARLAFGPSEVRFVAEDTGWLSLTETTLAPGFLGPVPHVHRGFVDSFYVLEGVLRLRVGASRSMHSACSTCILLACIACRTSRFATSLTTSTVA